MKDGAIVCNTGHYDCEINLGDLEARAKGKREIRPNNEEYTLQGRPPRLRAGAGPPGEPGRRRGPPVRGHGHVVRQPVPGAAASWPRRARRWSTKVYELPPEQDQELARIKLAHAWASSIDALTPEQIAYRDDYAAGT